MSSSRVHGRAKSSAAEILRDLASDGRSASALLWLGRVEVGRVDVQDGEVVHAEIPGAKGDSAIRMLPRLVGVRITVEELMATTRTVGPNWRELLGIHGGAGASVDGAPAPQRTTTPAARSDEGRGARQAFDELFADAMTAYLRRDYGLATELFEACEETAPGDSRVAHNLARLRNRKTR